MAFRVPPEVVVRKLPPVVKMMGEAEETPPTPVAEETMDARETTVCTPDLEVVTKAAVRGVEVLTAVEDADEEDVFDEEIIDEEEDELRFEVPSMAGCNFPLLAAAFFPVAGVDPLLLEFVRFTRFGAVGPLVGVLVLLPAPLVVGAMRAISFTGPLGVVEMAIFE